MTNEHQRPYKLILIEDNEGDIGLLHEALEEAGLSYELIAFADGADAISYIQSASTEIALAADLVLVDLNLPKVEGLDVVAALRRTPGWQRTPVVVLTSSVSPRDRERVEEYGVAQHIIKPADLDDYLRIGSTIREILESRGRSAEA